MERKTVDKLELRKLQFKQSCIQSRINACHKACKIANDNYQTIVKIHKNPLLWTIDNFSKDVNLMIFKELKVLLFKGVTTFLYRRAVEMSIKKLKLDLNDKRLELKAVQKEQINNNLEIKKLYDGINNFKEI